MCNTPLKGSYVYGKQAIVIELCKSLNYNNCQINQMNFNNLFVVFIVFLTALTMV